jgi:hypothetical protein
MPATVDIRGDHGYALRSSQARTSGRRPGVDNTATRRSLREQIARLERQLGEMAFSAFPHTVLDTAVPVSGGPRMLGIAELESQRDALQAKLREARLVFERRGAQQEANRVLLERMLLEPKKYKFARLHRSEVQMGGCGAYQVRPRLGLIGMLMGWWHVKLSSGCPLAT